jgi:hypothetical protein
VQHYKLVRNALPVHIDAAKHRSAKVNRDFCGERRVIKAALAALEQEQLFSRHFVEKATSLDNNVDADNTPESKFVSFEQALIAEVIVHESRLMAIEAMPFTNPLFDSLDPAASEACVKRSADLLRLSKSDETIMLSARERSLGTWSSEFSAGDYIEIASAATRVELNGQRARLYSKSSVRGKWHIRLLGKNNGIFLCSEKFFKTLSALESACSRPAPSDAGFLEVGVDASGQPTVDEALLAHRQFGTEYSASLTKRIEELKKKYPHVFTTDVTEPCLFEAMDIKLIPNAILPTKARWYRNTPKMRDEVRRQIQEQMDWKAVEKCSTPHVSDVLLVKRPHMPGKFRFVVNYTVLNDATVAEQLIMPDAKSQHERLAHNSIFGAIDMSSFYRQIKMKKSAQYLTGFASDQGTYVYTRVPMGLKNACAHSQRVLQEALEKDPILGPLGFRNYFDDLPFAAKSEDEFIYILTAILDFCTLWRLKVNPDKSVFGVTSITHVGFVVSKDGIAIDPERTKDIASLEIPRSIKKVQSVLGIFNYVRNFIPHFSDLAGFLTNKLGSKTAAEAGVKRSRTASQPSKSTPKFTWSEEDTKKFIQLKQHVLNAPLLQYLDYNRPIYIRCDASQFGCGAVLFQYDDSGREHVACYASRKFLDTETRWSTFQQEAATVVWALARFHEYTVGYHTIVECDHKNISFVKKSVMPQLARWRLILQEYDFSIRFLQGSLNQTADGLSRIHVDDVPVSLHEVVPECALNDAGVVDHSSYPEIAALYVDCRPELAPLASDPPRAARNVDAAEMSDIEINSDDDSDSVSSDIDDVDVRFGPNGELLDDAGQPVEIRFADAPAPPQAGLLPQNVIPLVHNSVVGHAGVYTTLQRALRTGRAWGSRAQMLQDVDSYIKGCVSCQKMKKRKAAVSDARHTISGSPFAELSIDILKLPTPDVMGNQYCVVIVDSFSHWTSIIACKNKSAYDAARALLQVVGSFGAPLRLRSDGGAEFLNGIISSLTRLLGVHQHVMLPYSPTANGIVERANRSILERLRHLVFSKHLRQHTAHQWSDLLPLCQRMINASIHSAIGTSPARVLFGDTLDLDRCILTPPPVGHVYDADNYVDVLSHNQRVIVEEANAFQESLCQKVISKMAAANRGKPARQFQVDNWVLVRPQPSFPIHKLAPRLFGPFRVVECSDDSEIVVVMDSVKNKCRKFFKRNLELFDMTFLSNIEGMKSVAERDHFEFPVESIIGHALVVGGELGVDPVQLEFDFQRGSRPLKQFQFLIRWAGYEEPTWIAYSTASRLAQFPGYVSSYPGLRMG